MTLPNYTPSSRVYQRGTGLGQLGELVAGVGAVAWKYVTAQKHDGHVKLRWAAADDDSGIAYYEISRTLAGTTEQLPAVQATSAEDVIPPGSGVPVPGADLEIGK